MNKIKLQNLICLWFIWLSGCYQSVTLPASSTPEYFSTEPLVLETPVESVEIVETNTPVSTSTHENDVVCIGDMEDFAWAPPSDEFDVILSQRMFPQQPWQLHTQFERTNDERIFEIHLAREQEGNTELWIYTELFSLEPSYFYLLMSPIDNVIERISADVAGNPGVYVNQLFLTQDGSVWGVNELNRFVDDYPTGLIPILSKFNETTRQFEFVIDAPQVAETNNWGFTSYDFEHNIVLDQEDRFWIHVLGEGIYQYDTTSGSQEMIFEDGNPGFYRLDFSKNGKLYLYQWFGEITLQPGELWVYDPETDILQSISSAPDTIWPASPQSILVDQQDRLWFDSIGWWDTKNDEWHLLHTYADEYQAIREKSFAWEWYHPNLLFESSNGHIWFENSEQRYPGTAWYDPETEDSCWFTTYSATIVEDNNQILWLVVYDRLYFIELSSFYWD